jgi:hypothetical protein
MNGHDDDHDWERNSRQPTESELEWFKLWFEFLNLSNRQHWTEDVISHFGDTSCSFEKWWSTHSYLFRIEKEPVVTEITSDEEYFSWKADLVDKDELEWSGSLIVAIPLYTTKEALRNSFEELLKKYHVGKAGRPDFIADQGNVFNFYDRPDTEVLNKILAVYKLYSAQQKKHKDDRMKLWEIEEFFNLIDKTSEKAHDIWKYKEIITVDEVIDTAEPRRRSQKSTVRKYINYAEQILENVALGCFPVYDGSKPSARHQTKLARQSAI